MVPPTPSPRRGGGAQRWPARDDLFDSDHEADRENVENEYRTRVPGSGFRRQPVKVPVFDGKVTWEAYYLQFSRIADRYGWGETEKLDRLIDSLRDTALKFLSHLNKATQNSFDSLVKAMESRFGTQVDKGWLVGCYRSCLRNRARVLSSLLIGHEC